MSVRSSCVSLRYACEATSISPTTQKPLAPPTAGPLQAAKSRLPDSQIWHKARRPGPHEYNNVGSMGTQPLSARASTTGFGFGGESKEGWNLNPSYSNQHVFDAEQSMGRQVTSRRPTQPRAHLGTSSREHALNVYNVHTYKPH